MYGLNWYVYCANNPIEYIDPSGMYNRKAAVKYALKWYNKTNKKYYSYTKNDCANFVSQCLYAGGIKKTSKWHSYRKKKKFWGINPRSWADYRFRYKWDVSSAWRKVDNQYSYFKNSTYSYRVLSIKSKKDIGNVAKNGSIKIGDIMYFARNNGENTYHATLITKIDSKKGKIYYSAHSDPRKNKDLSEVIGTDQMKILRIKSNAK